MKFGQLIRTDDAVGSTGRLLLTALAVFSPLLEGGTTHLATMMIRLMILLLGGSYLLIVFRQGALVRPRLVLDLPIVLFICLAFFSTILSPTVHQSRQWFMVISLYALLLYLIVFFAGQWKDIVWQAGVVIVIGLAESALALTQYSILGVLRPSGTFFNPNFLAGYLGAVFMLLLGLGVCIKTRCKSAKRILCHFWCLTKMGGLISPSRSSSIWRILWGGSLALLLAGLMVTGSRGGLLALMAGTGYVIVVRYRHRGLMVLLLALVALLVIPNPLKSRIAVEHAVNPVAYARLHMWGQALQFIVGHPLGCGLGLYQYLYPQYAFPIEGVIARYGQVAQTAHNEYLQLGVEVGLLGLAVFLWGIIRTAIELHRVRRIRLWRWQRGLVIGLGGVMVTILTHAMVDSNLHEPAIAILLTLAIGLLFAVTRFADQQVNIWHCIPLKRRAASFAGGILALCLTIAIVLKTGIAWLYFDAGSRAQRQGDVVRAIENYQRAVKLDPNKALYHSSLAAAHFHTFQQTARGDMAQAAIDELVQAVTHNPIDGRLRAILGYVYVTLAHSLQSDDSAAKKRDELIENAIQCYEKARELEPFSPFHRLELGRLYWLVGKRQKAIKEVRLVEDMEPNFLPAREWLARVYLISGSAADRQLAKRELGEILARQRRYEAVPKNALELKYLSADVLDLKAQFEGPVEPVS